MSNGKECFRRLESKPRNNDDDTIAVNRAQLALPAWDWGSPQLGAADPESARAVEEHRRNRCASPPATTATPEQTLSAASPQKPTAWNFSSPELQDEQSKFLPDLLFLPEMLNLPEMEALATFPTVRLKNQEGFVLHGQFPGSFCFVPRNCLQQASDGTLTFDRTKYLMDNWARLNVRLNPGRTVGSHLFPEPDVRPLPSTEPVRAFLLMAQQAPIG